MNAQEEFWTTYYGDVVRRGSAWLDYSNDRVQAQTFALALEAAGSVLDKRCIDFGCGHGQFSRTLSALGASSVTGIDVVPDVIAHHQREYPSLQWLCASLSSAELPAQVESYDIAFLVEVLQYVPLASAIDTVWKRLLPGGRIVAVVPNAECAIVSRTRERFGANYDPPTVARIGAVLSACPDLDQFAYRGLFFGANQQLVPYEVSPWRTSGWDEEPNRIQFVAIKRRASDN